MPKPGAFLPPKDLKMSVSRIEGLAENDIWYIADRARNTPAKARADFTAASVLDIQANGIRLTVVPDPLPHDSRHANVCGWPPDKDLQLSIAQEFCAKSMLRIRPNPNPTTKSKTSAEPL